MADIGNASFKAPGLAGPEDAPQAFERPRVNLKPRSQPIEPMERNTETARSVNCLKASLSSFNVYLLKLCFFTHFTFLIVEGFDISGLMW